MVFFSILKCSKTRLFLRVYDSDGVGYPFTFRYSKAGVTCVEISDFNESGIFRFSFFNIAVVRFSDCWRVDLSLSDTVCSTEIHF